MIREHEIDKYACIWVDKETHALLRSQKLKQKKSLMRIIKNLVEEKYGKQALQGNKHL